MKSICTDNPGIANLLTNKLVYVDKTDALLKIITDPTATVRVARALSVYGLGLCFFSVQKCLIPFFQAQGDMKTPLRVSVQTVFLNAALNVLAVVLLPVEWRHVGLAASTTFCALVGCVLFMRAPGLTGGVP